MFASRADVNAGNTQYNETTNTMDFEEQSGLCAGFELQPL